MSLPDNWYGRILQAALSEQPILSLNFYSFGMTLRTCEDDIMTEYPVDPAQAAVALAAKVIFKTGLLGGDTLFIQMEGISKTVVEYRKPKLTGIYLDGSENALRVPHFPDCDVQRVSD